MESSVGALREFTSGVLLTQWLWSQETPEEVSKQVQKPKLMRYVLYNRQNHTE